MHLPQGFKFHPAQDGVVRLVFDRPLDAHMAALLLDAFSARLKSGMDKLLVDRRNQEFSTKPIEAVAFGKQLGIRLAGYSVRVALLSNSEQPKDDLVAGQVFEAGVPMAQFSSENEALAWLEGEIQ